MANLQFLVHGQRLDEPKERGAATTSAALDWLGVLGGKSGLVHGEFRGGFVSSLWKNVKVSTGTFLVFKNACVADAGRPRVAAPCSMMTVTMRAMTMWGWLLGLRPVTTLGLQCTVELGFFPEDYPCAPRPKRCRGGWGGGG